MKHQDRFAFAIDCFCLLFVAAMVILFLSIDGIH
jgi:hypothetical protein